MPKKILRFNCDLCKATISLDLDEEFQEKFTKAATHWPYPFLHPHNGHWIIVFLDKDFKERGKTPTQFSYENGKLNVGN